MEGIAQTAERTAKFDRDDRGPIRVIADFRERCSGVLPVLERMERVEVRVEHLAIGDYLVDGRLLFERKTLQDFAKSIKDARLFRQVRRLASHACTAAIVLEGTTADLGQSRMRREPIQGALVTVALMYGLPVLRARRPEETALLMVYAARQSRALQSGAIPRRVQRPTGKRRAQLQVLQGLPGVGPERARRLLDAFGSIDAVVGASAEELRTVAGIGTTTAEAIRWVVSEPRAAYAAWPRRERQRRVRKSDTRRCGSSKRPHDSTSPRLAGKHRCSLRSELRLRTTCGREPIPQ